MVVRTRRSRAAKAEKSVLENVEDDCKVTNKILSPIVDCHEPHTGKIGGKTGSTRTAEDKIDRHPPSRTVGAMHGQGNSLRNQQSPFYRTPDEKQGYALSDDNLLETIAGIFLKRKEDKSRYSEAKLGFEEQEPSVGALTWQPSEDKNLPRTRRNNSKTVYDSIDIRHGTRCKIAPHPDRKNSHPDRRSKSWFELPTQDITEEVKTDLRVLRLRSTFDPKQFYKRFDDTKFPNQFHFGTVVEPSSDFFSARLSKAQRKRTLAEEVLHDPYLSSVRKKRYNRIQDEAWDRSSKGHSRKTEKARQKKKPRKAKH